MKVAAKCFELSINRVKVKGIHYRKEKKLEVRSTSIKYVKWFIDFLCKQLESGTTMRCDTLCHLVKKKNPSKIWSFVT